MTTCQEISYLHIYKLDLQVFKYFPVEMQSKRNPSFNSRRPVNRLNSIEFREGETKSFHFLFHYSLVHIRKKQQVKSRTRQKVKS